jgi:hypothetical protein
LGYDTHSGTNDPLLNASYIPQAGSPLISAGLNFDSVFTTDYAGNARPATENWTIGAYEYMATGMRTIDYGIRTAPLARSCWPNPATAASLRQYLRSQKTVTVYNQAGRMTNRNNLNQPGIYLLKDNGRRIVQKVVVLP